jgi:hypothetical protein
MAKAGALNRRFSLPAAPLPFQGKKSEALRVFLQVAAVLPRMK